MTFEYLSDLVESKPAPTYLYSIALIQINSDGSERFVAREYFRSEEARDAWIEESKIDRGERIGEKHSWKYVSATWALVDKIAYLES